MKTKEERKKELLKGQNTNRMESHSKPKEVLLYYAGRRLNANKLIHAYSMEVPIVRKNGSFFQAVNEECLMLFAKRLIGSETIGSSVRCTKTPTGVKTPYNFTESKAPKEVITFWSTLDLTACGSYNFKKENSKKLDGNVALLIEAIRNYAPSKKTAAIQALIKLL